MSLRSSSFEKLFARMWTFYLTLVFAAAVLGAPVKKDKWEMKPYEGHKLISVNAQTAAHVEILRLLQDGGKYFVDFFTHPHLGQVDIRIPPKDFLTVWTELTFSGLTPRVKVDNIQTLVDKEDAERKKNRAGKACTSSTSHKLCYLQIHEIEAFVDNLVATFPTRVRRINSGKYTHNGYEMWAVHISKDFNPTREAVIVESLTHAREWVTGSVALDVMDKLARQYGSDVDVTYMLDKLDWYFIPVHNPDGYQYTFSSNRLWRKNRQPFGICNGADLNRNWGVNFGGVGSSGNCFSDTFHGNTAFSTQETAYLRDLYHSIGNVKAFLSLHSYSQMLFIPYGYSKNLNYEDKEDLRYIAQDAADSIRAVNGSTFKVGTPGDLLYEASGGAYDYFKREGVKYSFTYELRPSQTDTDVNFQLPESEIDAAQKETWASFVTFVRAFN